jgi:hypothetical protein
MLSGLKGTEEELISQCSICGRTEALFDLPGTPEKFCWGCSADFATIIYNCSCPIKLSLDGREDFFS